MNRLDRIEQDIAGLSNEELARLRDWFESFEAKRFDRTIEDDAAAGRLDALAKAALAERRAGQTRPLSNTS